MHVNPVRWHNLFGFPCIIIFHFEKSHNDGLKCLRVPFQHERHRGRGLIISIGNAIGQIPRWWDGILMLKRPLETCCRAIQPHGLVKISVNQGFRNQRVLRILTIKTQRLTYQLLTHLRPEDVSQNFQWIKNIKDGTHCQCFGTHKDHGPWIPGTQKVSQYTRPRCQTPNLDFV